MTEIADVIRRDLVITDDNVTELIETAEMYACFENVSHVLREKCSSYYRNRKDPNDKKEASGSEEPGDEENKENIMDTGNTIDKEDNIVLDNLEVFLSSTEASTVGENITNVSDRPPCREIPQSGEGDAEDCGEENSICCYKTERDRQKMSLRNVCWVNFLNGETDLPVDITFKFYEKTQANEGGGEAGRFVGEIKAHQFLLASCSEVFKERFFNSLNLQPKEIIVEDSSVRAFKTMVDFIYGRFPRLRSGSDICEMFEIENVAEKFRVNGLKEEYKSSMILYFRHRYKEQTD